MVYEKHYPVGEALFLERRGDTLVFLLDTFVRVGVVGSSVAQRAKTMLDRGTLTTAEQKWFADMPPHRLTVSMPGRIRHLWGEPVDGHSEQLTFDLVAGWPPGGRKDWTIKALPERGVAQSGATRPGDAPAKTRVGIPPLAFWIIGILAVAVLWPRRSRRSG